MWSPNCCQLHVLKYAIALVPAALLFLKLVPPAKELSHEGWQNGHSLEAKPGHVAQLLL